MNSGLRKKDKQPLLLWSWFSTAVYILSRDWLLRIVVFSVRLVYGMTRIRHDNIQWQWRRLVFNDDNDSGVPQDSKQVTQRVSTLENCLIIRNRVQYLPVILRHSLCIFTDYTRLRLGKLVYTLKLCFINSGLKK